MTSRKINQSRKLSFQQLENRQMMSGTPIGNVTAKLKNGTLTITGDNNSDGIEITQSANNPSQLIITGLQQAYTVLGNAAPKFNPTTVNGKTTPVVFNGVTSDVNINLGSGNDVVQFGDVTESWLYLPRNLSVNMGNGNNQFTMDSATVGGKVSLTGGSGNDVVGIGTTNIGSNAVNGGANDLTVSLGGGNNTVELLYMNVEEDVNILDASSAQDTVYMYGGDVGRYLYVQTGSGADFVDIGYMEVKYLHIATGAGNDTVELGEDLDATDSVYVDLGAGNDTLNMYGVETNQATYLGGAGTDHYVNEFGGTLTGSFTGFEMVKPLNTKLLV